MHPDKITFLFGSEPVDGDPDDPDDRAELLARDRDEADAEADGDERRGRDALVQVLANQIAGDDPPEVWQAVQRLSADGLDRALVRSQLLMTLLATLERAVETEGPSDPDAYRRALDRLPLPGPAAVEAAMVAEIEAHGPATCDELEATVARSFGYDPDDPVFSALLDRVSEFLFEADGPLTVLAGDVVVSPEALCRGIVLTHRLRATDRSVGALPACVDLAGFTRVPEPLVTAEGEEIVPFSADPEHGHLAWHMPEEWFDRHDDGQLLAVTVHDGTVDLAPLDHEPAVDPDLLTAVRAAYDAAVEEPGLPVDVEDLLLAVRLGDRRWFATPQPPLGDLLEAAGLELRGTEVAHDAEIWSNAEQVARLFRLMARLDRPEVEAVLDALAVAEDPASDVAAWRRALDTLADPVCLEAAADELLGLDDDPGRARAALDAAGSARAAARRPAHLAAAYWLAALAHERLGDLGAAETALRRAVVADGTWEPALDRLAWYASDKGDAHEAASLWRRLGLGPEDNPDLAVVEQYDQVLDVDLGRNEPCWCGSGRKYKLCHLGRPVTTTLEERLGWLRSKLSAYLQRRGGQAARDVYDLAEVRAEAAGDPEAGPDSIIVDLALVEGGWLRRFLAERGPLLPEDEAATVRGWIRSRRSVYEVEAASPDGACRLIDLRTGEPVELDEPMLGARLEPGQVVLAMLVPVDDRLRAVGATLWVPPARVDPLLDLLEWPDAEALAEEVGGLERPPTLVTRENEPLVECRRVFALDDADAARSVLDDAYEAAGDDVWVEMHALGGGERILRATLALQGDRLSVETASEPRLERVAGLLDERLGGLRIVSTDRRRLRPGEAPTPPPHLRRDAAGPRLGDRELHLVGEELQEHMERRWCDEEVPALRGLTPRQAAADPVGRRSLERLLADFERMDRAGGGPPGSFTMRPARLRHLLGLEG